MITDIAAGIFLVAVVYLLVRPSSNGTAFVTAFSSMLSALIGQATDLASSTSSASTTQGN